PIREALDNASHQRRTHRPLRQLMECRSLDADRKDADAHGAIRRLERVFAALQLAALVAEIPRKIRGIALGLKADEIISAQCRNEPFVMRQSSQNLGWWKRNMQKKSDSVAVLAVVKHLRMRHHVIVVDT